MFISLAQTLMKIVAPGSRTSIKNRAFGSSFVDPVMPAGGFRRAVAHAERLSGL
jgi:hypothetical protein